MGHIIPPTPEPLDDELYYTFCGTHTICDPDGHSPDARSQTVCFVLTGEEIKNWYSSGKNGTCGPDPSGQHVINYRFKGTSITLYEHGV